jgi:hypothetical protein
MDKPPFSQKVVGVILLGTLTSVVGGFVLKWITDRRIAAPSLMSSGAPAAPRPPTGQLPQEQILTATMDPPQTNSASIVEVSALRARAPNLLSEGTHQIVETQPTSRSDQQRRGGYISATNLPASVEFLVCAETTARKPMGAFTTSLTDHLNGRSRAAAGFVFTPQFVTAGAFDSFFEGHGRNDLQNMHLSKMAKRVLLARVSQSVKASKLVEGLSTASVTVEFTVLSLYDGNVVDGFELTAVGAGTGETDAVSRALERILDLLGQHGY